MQDLKNYFIAIDREYKEGDVAVFRQKFSGENVVSAYFILRHLGVYEAEREWEESRRADVCPWLYLLSAPGSLSRA